MTQTQTIPASNVATKAAGKLDKQRTVRAVAMTAPGQDRNAHLSLPDHRPRFSHSES